MNQNKGGLETIPSFNTLISTLHYSAAFAVAVGIGAGVIVGRHWGVVAAFQIPMAPSFIQRLIYWDLQFEKHLASYSQKLLGDGHLP